MVFADKDTDILNNLKNIYTKCPEFDEKKMSGILKLNNSIYDYNSTNVFLIHVFYGYVISQNIVAGKILTTPLSEKIINNLLNLFGNVNDDYLGSLKLLENSELESYFKDENLQSKNFEKELEKIINSFNNIFLKMKQGNIYELLNDLNEVLSFIEQTFYTNKEAKDNYALQNILFENNIVNYVLTSFSMIVQAFNLEECVLVFKKLGNFLKFYLNENTVNISNFGQPHLFKLMDLIFKSQPELTCDLWIDLFETNKCLKKNLLVNDYIMNYFIDYVYEIHDSKIRNKDKMHYLTLQKILTLIEYFLDFEKYDLFEYIPEYDLDVQIELATLMEDYKSENMDEIYLKLKAGELNESEIEKFNFLIKINKVLFGAMKFRFSFTTYTKIEEIFSISKLENMLLAVKDNLELRTLYLNAFSLLHVDFKNNLLNDRYKFYFAKPPDMQYEEGK